MLKAALSILVLAWAVTCNAAAPNSLFVSPQGNDGWTGYPEVRAGDHGPFATLQRARDEARKLRDQGAGAIHVMVRGGVYRLTEPLVLEPEDGGSALAPVTYSAYPNETVTLLGSRGVTGWKPVGGGVYRADLKAQGLEGVSFHQLFCDGRRQILARHPNLDPEHPRTGGFTYVASRGPSPAEQFTYAEGALPFEEWGDWSQAEVWSVFGFGWNFAITPVLDVDTEKRLITVRKVRRPFEKMNRFFIQNVRAALDSPGEWYLDRAESVLYFYPPDGIAPGDRVSVPVLDNIIELRGSLPYPHGYLNVNYKGSLEDFPVPQDAPEENPVAHVTFRGFHVAEARQNGFVLTGARDCDIHSCTVTNVGNVGINLGGVASAHEEVGNPRVTAATGYSGGVGGGGQNLLFNSPCEDCRIEGNDVFSVGSDGIFLYGRRNVAFSNHVYDSGLFDKDCACINLWGEGNEASCNTLHDVPRNAVFLKGIENRVSGNQIYRTMLETCDGGAIRMCQRNLNLRGNVIERNRIEDTVGYGYPRNSNVFMSPYFSWGVYLDDFTCGTQVRENVIIRTGRGGVMVHGGSDNTILSNVIVNAGSYQFELVPIRDSPISGNRVLSNLISCAGEEAYVYRCSRWIEGSATFASNLIAPRDGKVQVSLGAGGKSYTDWDEWTALGLDRDSELIAPEQADEVVAGSGDFHIRDRWFHVVSVGCVQAESRASWPLTVADYLVAEEPFLYEAPAEPIRETFELDAPGRPPGNGNVMAPGKSRIIVSNEQASEGSRSLKFVDAPDLRQSWIPRIFYAMHHHEGTVKLALSLWLDPERPPSMYIDPRQYTDSGAREYLSGPMLNVTPDGMMRCGSREVARLPLGKWVRIAAAIPLGDAAAGKSTITVTPEGATALGVEVPNVNVGFRRLERVVISSTTDGDSVFFVDDISIEPGESGLHD